MSANDEYYEELRQLARLKRTLYNVKTSSFGLREVRAIYRQLGITIDLRPLPPRLKAIYMCDEDLYSVALCESLPDEPKIFALVHELKHHWKDQDLIRASGMVCGDYNRNVLIEIGAEVFAAEFIYPSEEFAADVDAEGIDSWTVDDVVRFKRERVKAKVSYAFILKALQRLGAIERDKFKSVQFKKREEELYGTPIYKQSWFVERRKRRASQAAASAPAVSKLIR